MYGMGAKLMAANISAKTGEEITTDRCREILDEFYNMFPGVRSFVEGNEKTLKEKEYVEDYLGRRRHLPGINYKPLVFKAHRRELTESGELLEDIPDFIEVEDLEGSEYWQELYEKTMANVRGNPFNKKMEFKNKAIEEGVTVQDNGAFISKATTQCTNAIIQGSSASLTKKAMLKVFTDPRMQDIGFKILIPIHDEMLGEVPSYYVKQAAQYLIEDMVGAAKPECSIGMKVDTYEVKHWYIDEIAGTVEDHYNSYIKGNPKKNISPVSPEEAYVKVRSEFPMLKEVTIKQMIDGTFDLLQEDI